MVDEPIAVVAPPTGVAATDTANIVTALATKKTVWLRPGVYYINSLTFGNAGQEIVFLSDCEVWLAPEATLTANISDVVLRGLRLRGPDALVGLHITAGGSVKLIDSCIIGVDGLAAKTANSIGILVDGDADHLAYWPTLVDCNIVGWETGVKITGVSHDNPVMERTHFVNNGLYHICYDPPFATGARIYNLALRDVHFEGLWPGCETVALYIGPHGIITSGVIDNPRLACYRLIVCDGAIEALTVSSGNGTLWAGSGEDWYVYELNGTVTSLVDCNSHWHKLHLQCGTSADVVKRYDGVGTLLP